MNKDQVVALMVEFINNQNRLAAAMQPPAQAKPLAEVEKVIQDMQPQLQVMCSGMYDALAEKGAINLA